MTNPAIRAGLLGGIITIILSFIGLVPALGCVTFVLQIITFVIIGYLAARWLTGEVTGGRGAGQGAVAGIIAGIIGWIGSVAASAFQLTAMGGVGGIIAQLPPESLDAFRDSGIDPASIINQGSILGITAICCGVGIFGGIGLAALGGFIGGTTMAGRQGPPPGGWSQPPASRLPDGPTSEWNRPQPSAGPSPDRPPSDWEPPRPPDDRPQ